MLGTSLYACDDLCSLIGTFSACVISPLILFSQVGTVLALFLASVVNSTVQPLLCPSLFDHIDPLSSSYNCDCNRFAIISSKVPQRVGTTLCGNKSTKTRMLGPPICRPTCCMPFTPQQRPLQVGPFDLHCVHFGIKSASTCR